MSDNPQGWYPGILMAPLVGVWNLSWPFWAQR